jgi:hypothetical protein
VPPSCGYCQKRSPRRSEDEMGGYWNPSAYRNLWNFLLGGRILIQKFEERFSKSWILYARRKPMADRENDKRYSKQPTCEERIDKELESRIKEFSQILENQDKAEEYYADKDELESEEFTEKYSEEEIDFFDEWGEDPMGTFNESILSVETYIVYKVMLSWGGPSDYFEFFVDKNNPTEFDRIVYHFQDWFDGAHRVLHGKEFEVASQMFYWILELDW